MRYRCNNFSQYRPVVLLQNSTKIKNKPKYDNTSYGIGVSWLIGLSTLRPLSQANGLEVGILYKGSWNGRFMHDDHHIKRGNINQFDKDYSDVTITAGNRITILPGTTIEPDEVSNFTAKILKLVSYYGVGGTPSTIIDNSGNLRDGILVGSVYKEVDRFDMEDATYFEQSGFYELNKEKKVPNPPSYPGLTLSMWVKFEEDPIPEGYIYSAMDASGGGGYYFKINARQLKFYIGKNNTQNNEISYNLTYNELNTGKYPTNNRWVHIAAVWSSGKFIRLYINGEERVVETVDIIDAYTATSDPYYIARGPTAADPLFIGCIDGVIVYSEVLADKHIKSHCHGLNWPEYQGDHSDMTATTTIGGMMTYTSSAGLDNEVHENSGVVFPVGKYWGNVEFIVIPNSGYVIDKVFVDSEDKGAISTYKFYDLTNDHAIAAYFKEL